MVKKHFQRYQPTESWVLNLQVVFPHFSSNPSPVIPLPVTKEFDNYGKISEF